MPLCAAAIATVFAVLLGGCQKTVNAHSAEALVTSGIESHSRLKVEDVGCPSDVPANAGTTFQCAAKTTKLGRYVLTIAILDDHGSLKVIDLKPATRVQLINLLH